MKQSSKTKEISDSQNKDSGGLMPVMPTSALDAELNDVLDEPNREADHDFTPGV